MFPWPDSGDAEAPKLRVLVVDDEPTLRLGFAYALSNKTTVVETAASGQQALDRLASETFDVVVLDLRMPGLDGVGVIKALRNEGSEIPVILCSAALNSSAALREIRHGVVDFLLKPVRPVD
ncbi:MAG: response regulator, partial [Akkermansiaceae bacterium]